MTATAAGRRSQAQRSATTRPTLIDAATASLVEYGYAHTTTVEVCKRAGLTRGAYNHHYADMTALFTDVLITLYERLAAVEDTAGLADGTLESLLRRAWQRVARPEFKAVIELWLASRNDPELGRTLAPAIARLAELLEPERRPELAAMLDDRPGARTTYRLAREAMIGLALGRATSARDRAVAHEDEVLQRLFELARDHDHRAVRPAASRPR